MTFQADDNGMPAAESAEENPYFWPVWRFDSGRAALSRYVAPSALPREAGLSASLTKGEEDVLPLDGQDALLFERLYERFLAKGIRYGREPWARVEGVQQIRHPWWLFNDRHGTCVDLATTFAGMCLNARLRTVVVLTGRHALVAISPGSSTAAGSLDDLDHAGFHAVEPGVEEGSAEAMEAVLASGRLVAADVVEVTEGGGYRQAHEAARNRLHE